MAPAERQQTKFLNVDLDIKSSSDLSTLTNAFGRAVTPMHVGRFGRRYWVRYELRAQPRSPREAIGKFSAAVKTLPRTARRVWNQTVRVLDIGIESGDTSCAEWRLDSRTVRAAAEIGAEIQITVYSAQDRC